MILEFDPEASDTAESLMEKLVGFGVDVVTEDGETIEGYFKGPNYAAGWFGTVLIQPYDFANDCPLGEVRSVVAERIVVA